MSDCLIIGGGINGLLLARELAREGAEVCLLERSSTGSESSWAGGGIVSPLHPWTYPDAVTALASWSQRHYPQLIAEIQEESGIDPEYRRCGLLMPGDPDSQSALAWAGRHGHAMELWDQDTLYRREPALTGGFTQGLWMPDVAQVRNPRLCQALRGSLEGNSRVRLLEQQPVIGLETRGARISAVVTGTEAGGASERVSAGQVIVCAGAWSAPLLQQVGVSLDVYPVKGQMLLYKFDSPPIHSILLSGDCYLIPRLDGHLLVGATVERTGFDKSISEEGRAQLEQAARGLTPLFQRRQPVRQWAGLRPGSGLGLPAIGRVPSLDNLYVNAGQYRNGLLLAPASARLLADDLLGREPILDPAPYLAPLQGAPAEPASA